MPAKFKHISGGVYGNLMFTGKCYRDNSGSKRVECICNCGAIRFLRYDNVSRGRQVNCGCARVKHKLYKDPLYKRWMGMKMRCYQKTSKVYKYYGGKGVTVCPEWLADFKVFYDWAIANGWKGELSLDRIDSSKGYNPENCRWATIEQQNRNRSGNVIISAFGESKCVGEWIKDSRCVVSASTLVSRINNSGWDTEKSLTTLPDRKLFIKKSNRTFSLFGETKCIAEWARDKRCVVSEGAFKHRIQRNWEPYLALTHII